MNASIIPSYARAALALVVGFVGLLVPVAQVAAADAACPQYRVIAARGSGQAFGTSREIATTLKYLQVRANATGVTLDTAGAELSADEYLALRVFPVNVNPGDENGPASLLTGVNAAIHSGPYQNSVAAGVTSVRTRLTQLSTECGTATKAILIGYSQGAEVMHRVENTSTGAERALIAGSIGYGDPLFDGSDPAATGSFDPRRHGLLGSDRLPSGIPNVSVCHTRDLICQGVRPTYSIFGGLDLGFTMSAHEDYAGAKGSMDVIGDTAGAVNALSRKLNWQKPPVGPGTGGPLDLVFVIDTTGSMGDDIEAVQQSMNDTVDRLSSVSTSWRVAVVDYKDDPATQDSAYRARLDQPFTTNVTSIRNAIANLDATGGGDNPESVYSGMMLGLNQPWRAAARRSLIVMGDAPAHDPEPGTGYRLATVTNKARSVSVSPTLARTSAAADEAPDPTATSASAYPIVVGDDPDARSSMEDIATGTNGRAFTSPRADDVPDAVRAAVSAAGVGLVADAGGPYVSSQLEPVEFSGANSSSVSDEITSYAWDFGDGNTSCFSFYTVTSEIYTDAGEYTAKLTITDAEGLTSVASTLVYISDEPADPPAAPTDVTAIPNADGSVHVSWTEGFDYAGETAGFLVSTGDGTPAAVVDAGYDEVDVTGLVLGKPTVLTVSQLGITKRSAASAADSVVPHAATRLTLAAPPRATYGHATRISGRLTTLAAATGVTGPVQVSTRRRGTAAWSVWRKLASSNGAGNFAAGLGKLPTSTDVRVRYAGTPAYDASVAGSRVAPVSYRITAARSAAVVRRGKPVRISGAVAPGARVRVTLQRKTARGWVAVANAATTAARRYVFVVRSSKVATTTYRVLAKPSRGLVAGYSKGLPVRVRR